MKVKVFGKDLEIDEGRIEDNNEKIRNQVEEFLEKGKSFKLSFSSPKGFTGVVMRELQEIPYGETRTYGEIASRVDSAPIAVGQACGNNPLPLIVPCHRVVGESSIGGYRYGRELKRKLIELEQE